MKRIYKAASWIISVLGLLGGLGYVVLRYRTSDAAANPILLAIAIFLLPWVCAYGLWPRQNAGKWKVLGIAAGVVCVLILGLALSKHVWRNLVALESLESEVSRYVCWNVDGETSLAPNDLPLKVFHRQGDETAHLAAAKAVRMTFANPFAIRKLIGERNGHNRSYWLARALSGHPPGLAILYAPVCDNPPLARIWAATILLACGLLAFWAGKQWSPDSRYGILAAAAFLCVPNLDWWHALSVSSDIPPALLTFAGFGFVGRALRTPEGEALRHFRIAGILLGLGCVITLTAFLPAFALAVVVGLTRRTDKWHAIAWLLLPALICLFVAITWSRLATSNHVVLSRVTEAGEETTTYTPPLEGVVTFVRRWPMDLGIPLCILFITLPLLQFLPRSDSNPHCCALSPASRLVGAALILLAASSLFWPEIRFAYPGWLVVLLGLGFQDYWESLTNDLRAVTVANIFAFGFAKFVLHNLLVVV